MTKLRSLLFSLKSGEKLLPRVRAFLLKEQQDIALGKKSHRDIVQQDAAMAVRTFAARQKEYNHDDPKVAAYYHPSRIGSCIRQQWFAAMNAPTDGHGTGEDLLTSHLTFENGTYTHVMLQNLISRAGCLVRREVPVLCDTEKIIGHSDGILRIDAERPMLEIKTINSRQIEKLSAPKPEHIMQATIYMGLLNLASTVFWYWQKDYPHKIKEYVHTFSRTEYQRLIQRIRTFRYNVANRIMPPKEGANPNKMPCSYCPYIGVCYTTTDQKAFLTKIKGRAT